MKSYKKKLKRNAKQVQSYKYDDFDDEMESEKNSIGEERRGRG